MVKHESIQTTWAKAKEAQRFAEKLITMAKRANPQNNRKGLAEGMVFEKETTLKKVFDVLVPRYNGRRCGYTRLLKLPPRSTDNAPMGVLEFVDGPKDIRFHMTAKTVGICLAQQKALTPITRKNIHKVLLFRKNGKAEFDQLVQKEKESEHARLKEDHEDEKTVKKDWKRGDPIPRPTYI